MAVDFFRPEARRLPPYNAGISAESVRRKYGVAEVVKLGSNENRFGSNPRVVDALKSAAEAPSVYPDPNCTELCELIARAHGIAPDTVIFGNGSESLIEATCHAALATAERVVTVSPSFGLHEIFPLAMGATVEKVPMTPALEFDLPRLIDAVSAGPQMLIFSNPSNPAGCILESGDFLRLISACSPRTLIVVDEAYLEYVDSPLYPNSLEILRNHPGPWLVLRTLSKAYGLAGLRVGYGIASDARIVSLLQRVRSPFSVNSAAQVAAAVALTDPHYLHHVICETRRGRAALFDGLKTLARDFPRVKVFASHANFLCIDTGIPATLVAERLMAEGVIIKPWLEPGYETFIRVTIGTSADNERFLDALRSSGVCA